MGSTVREDRIFKAFDPLNPCEDGGLFIRRSIAAAREEFSKISFFW